MIARVFSVSISISISISIRIREGLSLSLSHFSCRKLEVGRKWKWRGDSKDPARHVGGENIAIFYVCIYSM